jgi:hypothetical protein
MGLVCRRRNPTSLKRTRIALVTCTENARSASSNTIVTIEVFRSSQRFFYAMGIDLPTGTEFVAFNSPGNTGLAARLRLDMAPAYHPVVDAIFLTIVGR